MKVLQVPNAAAQPTPEAVGWNGLLNGLVDRKRDNNIYHHFDKRLTIGAWLFIDES
jgi:hypothetical protein